MDFDEVGRHLLAQRWIYAKTMPETPHWYTLRKEWANDEDFVKVVEYIREHGYNDPYKGRNYKALNVNEHKYWTMGAPLPTTILINRKPHTMPSPYDSIAGIYDALFNDPASLQENHEVMDMLDIDGSVLDIGCGSGLLLDYIAIDRYVGIDPSQAMLQRLERKHPYATTIHTGLESYIGDPVDLAVSLFGSANYIRPSALHRIPRLAKRWFIMFFKPGYQPVTYERAGIDPIPFNDYTPGVLPGDVTEYHNFMIVQGAR